jgi:signal transduction histidine kinase
MNTANTKIIVSFLFLVHLFPLFGQQDSRWLELEKQWKQTKDAEDKMRISLKLSQELSEENVEKALFYAKNALEIANQKNIQSVKGEIYLSLAEISARKRKEQDALDYLKKASNFTDTTLAPFVYTKAYVLGIQKGASEASRVLEQWMKANPISHQTSKIIGQIYLEYASNQLRLKNYKMAIEYANKAILIFEKTNEMQLLGRCFNLKGLSYKNEYYYVSSIENYIKAVNIYRLHAPKSRNLTITYLNLGNVYLARPKDTFNYKNAEEAYVKSLNLAISIQDTVQMINGYERLGSLALLRKQHSQATELFGKGFELAKNFNSQHLQNFLNVRLANAYHYSGETAKAQEILKAVFESSQKQNDWGMQIDAIMGLSTTYQDQKQYQNSLDILQKGIDLAKKNNLKFFLMLFYDQQSFCYIEMRQIEKAEMCLREIEKLNDINDRNMLLSVAHKHKIIDSLKGDYTKALFWAHKHALIKDSIFFVERLQSFNDAQQRFQADEKEEENRILKIKHEKEQENNRKNIVYIVILTALAFVLFALGLILFFKQKKLREINAKMMQQDAELRDFSKRLAQINEELLQKHNFDSKLITIISHDLRGPIQSVKTLLEMMQQGDFELENQQSLLALATSSLGTSSCLLDNILFWAKSYQSNFQMKTKQIAIKQLCENTIELLALQAQQKGILLENLVSEKITCLADEDAINLTIRNLLANAIKFTREGKVTIEAEMNHSICKIYVRDTGVGIAADNLEKIFQKNYYTKGTHEEQGTGLGLMLCKEFVERNGGRIQVESEVGKGTTFIVELPAV